MNLKKQLFKRLNNKILNYYGEENFDEFRYGIYPNRGENLQKPFISLIYDKFLNFIGFYNLKLKKESYNYINNILERFDLSFIDQLSHSDRNLYLELICYRILGYRHVRLNTNSYYYWQSIKRGLETETKESITFDFGTFNNLILCDLSSLGKNLKLYFLGVGIAVDFIIEQYCYNNEQTVIKAKEGDVVLDLGGCWGDTAIYFADIVGESGKVYSFEFIPSNITVFKKNLELNDVLSEIITIVPQPVSNISDVDVYYYDNGPSSKISSVEKLDVNGVVKTLSIDDFVLRNNINKVDFIKMDIEGAELTALEGAKKTIRTFKPKLAVAIYHSDHDFFTIPQFLHNLGYKVYINHYTIHLEETICFAIPI